MSDQEEVVLEHVESDEVILSSTLDYYSHLKSLLESMEHDVLKNQKGNKSAGVRLRKSLRVLKTQTGDFIKFTLGK